MEPYGTVRVVWRPIEGEGQRIGTEHTAHLHHENLEGILKTKDIVELHNLYAKCNQVCSPLFAIFVTVRVDKKTNFLKDFFLPLTANYATKVKNTVLRYFAYLGYFIVDVITLIFRVITIIPRLAKVDTFEHIQDKKKGHVMFERRDGNEFNVQKNGIILISNVLEKEEEENEKPPNLKQEFGDQARRIFIRNGTWYSLSWNHACDIPSEGIFVEYSGDNFY